MQHVQPLVQPAEQAQPPSPVGPSQQKCGSPDALTHCDDSGSKACKSTSSGGTPLRRAAKRLPPADHAETGRKDAKKRRTDGSKKMQKVGTHNFVCMYCDSIKPLLRSDRVQQCYQKEESKPVSLDDLDVSENCKAFLYSRFGHRTLTFCGECANREVIPFIDVVNSTEPTNAELDVTYSIEAHFDRSYGSGQAFDSRGHFDD